MSVWLCRAGRLGEHEARFLEENKIFYTFEEIDKPLSSFETMQELQYHFIFIVPSMKEKTALNFATQGNAFCNEMKPGDWVITPSKSTPGLLHIAEITGSYAFDETADEHYRHYRPVKWFAEIRREQFDQDIQNSINTFMTICKVKQEDRVRKAVEKNSGSSVGKGISPPPRENLEITSLDEISDFIIQNYKGHGLARIVEAILKAKGLTVFRSPEGADHGVDLLASSGALGFASPKICVQVKSGKDAIDRSILDQLLGTMTNVGAEYGLLVSWGGFRKSFNSERRNQFFKVRLWSRIEILNEFLECYDAMDDEIKQEIPLKRIWVLEKSEDDES